MHGGFTMAENTSEKKSWIGQLAISLALSVGAGVIAGLFSMNAKAIFASLIIPPFSPPSWLFMPVWAVLYVLIGIAFFLVFKKGTDNPAVKNATTYFIIQLVFNILWSVLFFTLNLRIAAFVDIIILLIYIIITTVKFFKIDKAAGILMLPYLLWVGYATALNLGIVILNG